MRNQFEINRKLLQESGWRQYQSELWRNHRRPSIKRWLFRIAAVLITVSATISLGFFIKDRVIKQLKSNSEDKVTTETSTQRINSQLTKLDVQRLLNGENFINLRNRRKDVVIDGQCLTLETSLDLPLQNFLIDKMDRFLSRRRAQSRHVGIVALNPDSGKIVAMVGFDENDQSANPCVGQLFPAASVFKLITAAAAVEELGYTSETVFNYNGRKHTLYKSQLKNRINKYTNRISLRDSFAQSVNPVFGKIGFQKLRRDNLEKYAEAFGFNQSIQFEIPLVSSEFIISDEPYQWAEIASGFNRKTVITPLHGALLASVPLNKGRLLEPTLIDRIVDESGKEIYSGKAATYHQTISPESASIVRDLMRATITSGTCRKTFRGFQRDSILSQLNIGGKTGSINNATHDARYDWFVGYAQQKNGPVKLAISVVVAHGDYIGTKASQYAKIAMRQYFSTYSANSKTQETPHRG